ncbi:hypothetical protein ACOME3_008592 [Neoechinorhynchus agilis]
MYPVTTSVVLIALTAVSSTGSQFDGAFTDFCTFGIREDNINYINCAQQNLIAIPDFSKFQSVCDELVLSDNFITSSRAHGFNGIQSLKRLHLNGNPIKQLDSEAFSGVDQSLEYLAIDFDPDVETPTLPILPALKYLTITSGKIPFWSNSHPLLSRSFKLRQLIINRCGVQGFEAGTLKLFKYIEHIDLSYNTFTALYLIFVMACLSLITLNLSHNSVTAVNELDLWPRLEVLDLSHNHIRALPQISSNGKCNAGMNSTLKTLFLRDNYIQQISPCLLLPFQSLEKLDLSQNLITHLNGSPFKDCCTNLTEIRLDNQGLGGLRNVDPLTFKNLKSLDLFNLSSNSIRKLTFAHMVSVKMFDISHNRLESLPNIEKTCQIGIVNMSHNLLSQLNIRRLSNLAGRIEKNILLDKNPIHCACDLLAFLNNSLAVLHLLQDSICRTPGSLRGTRLQKIPQLIRNHCSEEHRSFPHVIKLEATRDKNEIVTVSWEIANPDKVMEFFVWIQVPGKQTMQYRVEANNREYKIMNVTHGNCRACVLTLTDHRLSNKHCTKVLDEVRVERFGNIRQMAQKSVYPLAIVCVLLLITFIIVLKTRYKLKTYSSSRNLVDCDVRYHHEPHVLMTSYSIGCASTPAFVNGDSGASCHFLRPQSLAPPVALPLTKTMNMDVTNEIFLDSDADFENNDCKNVQHIYQELCVCQCKHCRHRS